MNTITIALAILAVILIEGFVIYALYRDRKKLKAENDSLKNKCLGLKGYIEKLIEINADEKETAEKIKEAQTDEEVYSILNDIILANNSKLQDHKN